MKVKLHPIGRREFIRKGFMGGAALAALPLLDRYPWADPSGLLAGEPSVHLDRDTFQRLLAVALENGGDFAEIYVEHLVENQIGVSKNKIDRAVRGIDRGVGIRVIKGGKTGYAYSGDFDFESLKETARVAAMVASGKATEKIAALVKGPKPSYYLVKTYPDSVMPRDKAKFLLDANALIRGIEASVDNTSISFSDRTKKIALANSEGVWAEDTQVLSELFLSVEVRKGDKQGMGFASKNGTIGYEHFSLKETEELGREALAQAVIQLEAVDAPAGEFPIVLKSGDGGVFFHEAIGHSLEADAIRHKSSHFWDKRGRKIASDLVTLVDDGSVIGGRGSINIDDEGTPGQNTLLIDRGICAGFMYDKLSARLMNARPTGNGRRQSYQFPPIPRMTNTYLTAGPDDPADILRSVKYGILIEKILGGNVDVTTGKFVFEATGAHLIEDGKKTQPLKRLQLIGSGPEVLMNITMVGNDLVVGGAGNCGKDGQGKPCGEGNPTFKVAKITVGGSRLKRG